MLPTAGKFIRLKCTPGQRDFFKNSPRLKNSGTKRLRCQTNGKIDSTLSHLKISAVPNPLITIRRSLSIKHSKQLPKTKTEFFLPLQRGPAKQRLPFTSLGNFIKLVGICDATPHADLACCFSLTEISLLTRHFRNSPATQLSLKTRSYASSLTPSEKTNVSLRMEASSSPFSR